MYIELRDNSTLDDYAFEDPLLIDEITSQLRIPDLLDENIDAVGVIAKIDQIGKSKLGSMLLQIPIDQVMICNESHHQSIEIPEFEIEDEITDWIKRNNIDMKELIPDLIRNFYRTMKKVQKNVAF